MRMILWILAALVGAFVLALLIAALAIPTSRSSSQSIVLTGSIDEVWQVYTDIRSQPEWRSELSAIRITSEGERPETWVEVNRRGPEVSFSVIAWESPTRLELETSAANYFTGSYVAEFEDLGEGKTRGTFTESVTTLGFIPRIMGFLFFNPRKFIEQYAEEAQAEIERRRQ